MKIKALTALPITLSLSYFFDDSQYPETNTNSIVVFDMKNPDNADVYVFDAKNHKNIALQIVINEDGIIQLEEMPKFEMKMANSVFLASDFISEEKMKMEQSNHDK